MWTVETEYLSAERKATTGNCIVYGDGGEYIATVPAKAASLIVEAPAMVEALRRVLQWIDAGCDPSRKSLQNARAILSRIDGAGEALPDAPTPAPAPTASARDDLPALLSDLGAFLSGFDGCEFNGEAVESLQARIAAQVGER